MRISIIRKNFNKFLRVIKIQKTDTEQMSVFYVIKNILRESSKGFMAFVPILMITLYSI